MPDETEFWLGDQIETAYPPMAAPSVRLRAMIAYAVLAPSSHNSQPWRFRIDGNMLELRADRTRALPVVDPHDRELIISCGAALANLRVTMAYFGYEGVVRLLPDPTDSDLLACVSLGAATPATLRQTALFRAIPVRRTNRRPFRREALSSALCASLYETACDEGAQLRFVRNPTEKERVAELIAEGDRRQAADPAFRQELASWIHPNRSHSRDGMPGYAFAIPTVLSLAAPWLMRTFNWGNGRAAAERELAIASPTMLVIGSRRDTPLEWLRTGQALGMVLLHATAHGVSASFLNQPVEVPTLRAELARLLDLDGVPQLVLRLGFAEDVRATPRRDVDDVVDAVDR